MNRMSTVRSRVPGVGLGGDRSTTARVVTALLLAALLVPLLMALFAPSAMADDEEDNYSMYKLASNAAGYFSEAREPGSSLAEPWPDIAASQPGAAGSLMGYGDANVSEFARWMTAGMSGSTQTISYDTLRSQGEEGGQSFDAMLTYAEFGAANRDLGLDSMSSSIMGDIMNKFSGSIVYFFYAMALLVSVLFWLVIQFLQILNPFMWFYQAIHAINPTFAEGMVGGTPPGDSGLWSEGGALAGLSNFVSEWYSLIYEMAWQAMVPLFVGVLLISLVLFKKMDRGSAIKKLVVRVVFIGVGLPLLGSLYTGVLDKFDDSLMGQHSGPTRVVLSTYVDFDAWAMNGRLHIPDEASIGWNEKKGQADPSSQMSVRTTALAINAQSHSVLNDMNVGTERSDATSAWEDGSAVSMSGTGDSVGQVVTTFGILNRFISGAETTASDFESGIKGNLSETVEDSELKEKWFIKKDTYGDVEEFGIEGDPMAADAPMISTNGAGLQGTVDGSGYRQFTSTGTTNCGFKVHSEGDPIPCNLSPLSMYNYLNSSFSADSMTAYSSENAMSGLVRETHSSVSQVGTGPAAVMFWANTVTILGSLVILGVWYAVGMVVASFRRTFGILAATPFATLGAIGAISKVIIYSIALILELVVTLFLYQFVSELLISVPGILAGPVSNVMSEDGLLGSYLLGSVVVVALTFVSTVIILGITFALLRIRKQVLQAMDEVVTKLVDKFMDTNTAPKGDKGGMMPALASGLGAGAGMAAGNKIANGFNRGGGGPAKSPGGQGGPKDSGGFSNSTNAGGLNPRAALAAGQGGDPKLLEAGKGDGSAGEGPDGPGGTGTGGGGGDTREISPGGSPLGLPPGKDGQDGHNQGQDSPTAPGSGGSGTGASDKETAQRLSANGGLSNLGYNSEGSRGSQAVGGGRGESIPGELVGPSGEGVKGDQNSGQGLPGQNGQPGHRGGGMKGQGLGEGTSFGTGAHAQSGTNAEGTTPNGNVPEPGTKLAGKSNVAPLSEPGTNFGTGQHPQAGQQAESTAMPSSSKSGAAVVGGQGTSFGTGAHAQSGTN
ncbi:MAG: hypothetical protein L0H20_13740, partial [Corynebacterium sp.]|nr:hypothetical protein [Corynebacterium sp.]